MNRLFQFRQDNDRRAVAASVDGDDPRILEDVRTVHELAERALAENQPLGRIADRLAGPPAPAIETLLRTGRILAPYDHPDPAHLLVSGTGLTHSGSAKMRQAIHSQAGAGEEMTDSMKMFRMGLENGRPEPGRIGVQPEWFYKGDGSVVVPPEAPLSVPAHAWDGGEEVELCGVYLVDREGRPRRIGHALGNEFSDHKMEKENYLYLAASKLRMCSFGPELHLGDLPRHIEGTSRILRGEEVVWSAPFETGEDAMSHTFANLEYHHFKHEGFRQPGRGHLHFFGTGTVSFAANIEVRDGDVFHLEAPQLGASLRNPVLFEAGPETPLTINSL